MEFWGSVPGTSGGTVCQTGVVVARPRHTLRSRAKIYPKLLRNHLGFL